MELSVLKDIPSWNWPEGVEKTFIKVLKDKEATVDDRCTAAQLAGTIEVVKDEIVDLLLGIVQNEKEPDDLRGRAAIGLSACLQQAEEEGFDFPEDVAISEEIFNRILDVLKNVFDDESEPKYVRRMALEASVRAQQHWHDKVIAEIFSLGDEEWKLTAVFCMRWVPGFAEQILEALESDNDDIVYEAVCAAGNWGVRDAWRFVSQLAKAAGTEKWMRLAAIEAVAGINPEEAEACLGKLLHSDDEDVVDAVNEAIHLAELSDELEDLDENFDDFDDDYD